MLNLVAKKDNEMSLKSIQHSKIKDPIFQMGKYKALRHDGFEATFFKVNS